MRCAFGLGDTEAVQTLVAMLDAYRPGDLVPMLVAERALVGARLASVAGDPGADGLFTAAITALRERSTPYHLAQGLLDHAEHLGGGPAADRVVTLVAEARQNRLRTRRRSGRLPR